MFVTGGPLPRRKQATNRVSMVTDDACFCMEPSRFRSRNSLQRAAPARRRCEAITLRTK